MDKIKQTIMAGLIAAASLVPSLTSTTDAAPPVKRPVVTAPNTMKLPSPVMPKKFSSPKISKTGTPNFAPSRTNTIHKPLPLPIAPKVPESILVDYKTQAKEIKQKSSEILEKLELNDDPFIDNDEKIAKSCKLLEFVVQNSKYDESIMAEKLLHKEMGNIEISEIHRTLMQGKSVCTGDSSTLSFLLRKIGIDSRHATIADNENPEKAKRVHEITLAKIGEENYVLDPTLVRTALEHKNIPDINQNVAIMPQDFYFGKIRPNDKVVMVHEPIEPHINKLIKDKEIEPEK